MKYQAGPGRHRRVLAPLRTLITRFSEIPCSIDEPFSPFLFSPSGDFFSSVFLRQVSVANSLCLGISRRRFPLMLVSNWRDEAFWTGGGEGSTASGFQAPGVGEAGVLVRSWNGVFFFHSWLSAWEATRMKGKAKLKIAFSDAYERGQEEV